MPKKKQQSTLQKTWQFIWHDDSLASWLVNIILAFVIIKFIVYPGLGVVFGTSFPIVAVVSESMEHEHGFDDWWETNKDYYLKNNITEDQFYYFPFTNGFRKGDIMILFGKDSGKTKIGDVIVYQSGKPYPIIHRVIGKKEKAGKWYFSTKGDNNKHQIVDFELDETNVHEDFIYGNAVIRIPLLGYVKIWFVDLISFISTKIF